ncbi:DUF6095 family protein [Urechidicola croceus]|uniref:Uncharacterized protein n=1 Tax=Urechidicola croceus TaxID=1850246 RepID=A0A1D8PBI6_9FLAO|nr:DUF6095 family protein [Urechidicola croceus]AOW21939.1 hypothetical protein LPB138_15130 [Urechidicola croceus]
MSSSKEIIFRGIKYLGIALPLMFLGPFILSIGLRAKNDGIYIWLIIGIIICITAMILGFLGIRTILKGFFDTNE